MKTGVQLINEERERQISEEGFTFKHDDLHMSGELAMAAACYASMPLNIYTYITRPDGHKFVEIWPWDSEWYKPTPEDRVKELVKAGALIAAEIDRLQRKNL